MGVRGHGRRAGNRRPPHRGDLARRTSTSPASSGSGWNASTPATRSCSQQELRGKLLGEADGCLFPIEQFNETRVFPDKDDLPQWRRVVVAIDPATTSKDSSDESGIVVMAEGDDGDFYCLEDCSGRFPPDQQMRVVAEAYYRNGADCVVGEVNMTGDYMRALLNTVGRRTSRCAPSTACEARSRGRRGRRRCSCRAASTWSATTSGCWKTSCPRWPRAMTGPGCKMTGPTPGSGQ